MERKTCLLISGFHTGGVGGAPWDPPPEKIDGNIMNVDVHYRK